MHIIIYLKVTLIVDLQCVESSKKMNNYFCHLTDKNVVTKKNNNVE